MLNKHFSVSKSVNLSYTERSMRLNLESLECRHVN